MSVNPNPLYAAASKEPPPIAVVAPVATAAVSPTAGRPHRRVPEKARRYLVRVIALAVAIVFWQWASSTGLNLFVKFENVPTPLAVWDALLQELSSHDFYMHILYSLQRIGIAFALAAVLGVALGIAMGLSKWAEDIILPYIELLRPIPAVAWIPLAILMMPSEESSIIFITFLGALFPIALNTSQGVEQSSKLLIRAARSLGAKHRSILWHVVIPGAMPSIVTGLAVGMGVAWFSLLAGEIISGQYGIGYFTWASYTLIEYPKIIIGMLTIGGLGTLCTLLVRLVCSPILRWQKQGGH